MNLLIAQNPGDLAHSEEKLKLIMAADIQVYSLEFFQAVTAPGKKYHGIMAEPLPPSLAFEFTALQIERKFDPVGGIAVSHGDGILYLEGLLAAKKAAGEYFPLHPIDAEFIQSRSRSIEFGKQADGKIAVRSEGRKISKALWKPAGQVKRPIASAGGSHYTPVLRVP